MNLECFKFLLYADNQKFCVIRDHRTEVLFAYGEMALHRLTGPITADWPLFGQGSLPGLRVRNGMQTWASQALWPDN